MTFRPRGNSMDPLVKNGQEVTVSPLTAEMVIGEGSIVLCKVKGKIFLHKVLAVGDNGFLIGNNKGHTNGWTRTVYGLLTAR